jgi:hypothetical protein
MNNNHKNERIFSITIDELQLQAECYIGRRLTDNELRIASKCIESGLSFGLDTVVKTAIEAATET